MIMEETLEFDVVFLERNVTDLDLSYFGDRVVTVVC